MLDKNIHRQILFQILKDIFESNFSKHLAFKGWTACYFLHGLDRFSTDLDFDLLDGTSKIDDEVINILKKYGTIKKWNKIVLSYANDADNIKIDINRSIWKNNTYEIKNFFGTDIRVQTKDTIFANKLVALTERNTNRDIYDVYFFFKNRWEINEKIILERTGKTKKELFGIIVEKLKNLWNNYKILDGSGEVLDSKQKAFVKEKLVKELIGVLEFQVSFG